MIHLYVKQHSVTGLKYFGKTERNPNKYCGSGKLWKRHIKKYGKEFIDTLQIFSFEDQEEATAFAIKFSRENNIVESNEWANLQEENAVDGNSKGNGGSKPGSKPKSKEWREQHSKRMSGPGNPKFNYVYNEEEKENQKNKMLKFYLNNPEKKKFGSKNHKYNDHRTFDEMCGEERSKEIRSRMGHKGNKHSNYNSTLYKFIHKIFGIEYSTRYDLKKKYPEQKLTDCGLRDIINGKLKQHKGWRRV